MSLLVPALLLLALVLRMFWTLSAPQVSRVHREFRVPGDLLRTRMFSRLVSYLKRFGFSDVFGNPVPVRMFATTYAQKSGNQPARDFAVLNQSAHYLQMQRISSC